MKKVLTVLLIMLGTLSAAYASEEVSLTALVNNAALTFNTGEMPANSVITSATLNLTGRDTSNGVELFDIRVLANGQIAGHLSSDEWRNDAENSIWLDASKLNIINQKIQLQIASSLEGSELLPTTAALVVNYALTDSVRAGQPRTTVTPAIAAGVYHTLALKIDGSVWQWGGSKVGSTPVQVTQLTDIIAIAAGRHHKIALKNDGTVWTWGGWNYYGELGNGGGELDDYVYEPAQVIYLTDVKSIAAGYYHTVAVKTDGTVWTWGLNDYGQLGNGTITNSSQPVQVRNLTAVSSVSAGANQTFALKTDGTVWAWGYNGQEGRLGDGTNISQILPVKVINLTDVSAISAGAVHTVALKKDGTVWAWGSNGNGRLGDGTTTDSNKPIQVKNADMSNLKDILAVSAGDGHTVALKNDPVALKNDQTVWAWGYNDNRWACRIGNSANDYYDESHSPIQVMNLTNIIAIDAGTEHTVTLKNDGTVWSWGKNNNGELGDGNEYDRSCEPVKAIGINLYSTAKPPTGTTVDATNVKPTSATLNATINPNGLATTYYFEYGNTTTYGYQTTEKSAGSGTSNVAVTFSLTGLIDNLPYHFRIVAKNSLGTFNGQNKTFTTPPPTTPPTATTGTASVIGSTTATVSGTVNPKGTETKYYFQYGTTGSYGKATASISAGAGTADVAVTGNITGLTAETEYNFRLVADNGTSIVKGLNQTFTTTKAPVNPPPTVTTGVASSIAITTATLNGTVNPNGAATTYSFEYGLTTSYDKVTTTTSAGSGTTATSVNAKLTGLTAKTTYNFRLVATNSAGTTTENNQTFTTLDTPPVGTAPKLTLSSASGASGTAVTLNLLLSNVTGTNISAVSTDIDFDTALLDTPTAVIGAAATAAGKETITVDMVDSNTVRIAVFSMSNSKAIGDGVVASITFAIKPTATNGASVTLTQSAVGSDTNGNDIAMTGVEGKISVNNCKLGDCNCDGAVTIGEVQSAVNMYLSTKTVAPCCDRDGNGAVSIAEVQAVINNFRGIEKSADNRSDSDGIADTRNDSDRIATATTPTLTLEGKSATAGETIKLALTLSTNGAEITSVSTDIAYDVNLFSSATAEIGAAGTDAGKIIIQSDLGGKIRVGVYSINNSNLIGDGVVAYINLTAKSTATGTASIKNTASGADQDAKDIVITGNTAQVSFSGSGTGTKPTVVISPATLITANSAKLAGTVKPNGKATTYYFEFGATTTYGQKTASFDAGSGTLAVAVGADMLGLNAGTTYHFRLVATNSAGTTTSADKTFITTSALKPVVTTELATLVTATTARLNGTVNPNGLATSYYFQYGTTTSYGSTTRSLRSGSDRASFSVNKSIIGLAKATVYHFRIVAINSAGTTYGLDKTFTTLQ